MTTAIVNFANWAHHLANPWLRRSAIVLATLALAVLTISFWLLMPLLFIVMPFVAGILAFAKSIGEIPRLTVGQFLNDTEDWERNLAGAVRIWRAQKVEAVIIRNPTPRPATNEGDPA